MPDWQRYLSQGRGVLARVPKLSWAAAAVIGASLAFAAYLEMSSPPYVALYDGLAPADGGKVITQLQKLGIPYQLQAAGNVILVPASQLASARLQLGAAQVPGGSAANGWEKVENAPMTASDLAQTTMATQALEDSLAQSIESLSGVTSAQVYLALPQDTPFLADQPKPTASVVIAANQADADAAGAAIASLVAGAVPGLDAQKVSVQTTSGVRVFPIDSHAAMTGQFATVSRIEDEAEARVATLLIPLVGSGHFRIGTSADLDFTHEQIHQIAYGPDQLVSHRDRSETEQTGTQAAALGIPGALSNEPPAATTAAPPPTATGGGAAASAASANGGNGAATGGAGAGTAGGGATATGATGATGTGGSGTTGAKSAAGGGSSTAATQPQRTSTTSSESYVTDQSESDITKPDWTVRSIAISVVLDKNALHSTAILPIKEAIRGAFSYPQVDVNVMAAPFTVASPLEQPFELQQAIGPLSHAILKVLAAIALLFGLALPLGRRISNMAVPRRIVAIPTPPRPIEVAATLPPPLEFTGLREQAAKNIPGVARLLQSWVDEIE
jgi:flagellar M-ring protein FliF